ncbi:unnamed protein product, partial [Tenebrio molitor]
VRILLDFGRPSKRPVRDRFIFESCGVPPKLTILFAKKHQNLFKVQF